jgi:hypothetical protein
MEARGNPGIRGKNKFDDGVKKGRTGRIIKSFSVSYNY